jgi:carboxypeptidase Q
LTLHITQGRRQAELKQIWGTIMRTLVFALSALALALPAHAQQQTGAQAAINPQAPPLTAPISAEQQRTVERLAAAALESDLAWRIVEDLVTSVGPRMAGSEAEARARDWAVATLRTQRFANVRIEPFTMPYWQATREDAQIVAPVPQNMVAAALGGSPSTPPGGLEAEVVRFTGMAELEAAPRSHVEGRIVSTSTPGTSAPAPSTTAPASASPWTPARASPRCRRGRAARSGWSPSPTKSRA